MHIKSILAAAAIALAASVGSAYAADQFATLEGIQAVPMKAAEMDALRGSHIFVDIKGIPNPPAASAPGNASFADIHIGEPPSPPGGDPRE